MYEAQRAAAITKSGDALPNNQPLGITPWGEGIHIMGDLKSPTWLFGSFTTYGVTFRSILTDVPFTYGVKFMK